MRLRNPLRPWVFLARRPGRALPTAFVIASVTLLLVVVITPGNTFRYTLDANLAALDVFTVVSPARRAGFEPALRDLLDRNRFAERWVPVKALWVRYPAIIGEGSCPLLLARPEEARAVLDRLGMRLVAGRHASGPEPVLVLHEDVARARGIGVGSRVGTLVDPDDIIPGSFEVVGLVRGPARVAVGVVGAGVLASMLHGRLPTYALIYPRPGLKEKSDAYLHAARDGTAPAFQIIDAAYARTRAERALKNLPLLVRFLSIATACIVSLVVMLLTLLSFQSRLPQFAILLAIGQRRRRLLRSVTLELSMLAVGSWLLGASVALAGLAVYDVVALQPRGILIHVWDPGAIAASATIPVFVILAGLAVLWRGMAHVDPVSIIQQRLP